MHILWITSNEETCRFGYVQGQVGYVQLQFSSYRYIGPLATGANHLDGVQVTASNY